MKKLLSIVLSIVILFTSIGYVNAAEASKTGPVYSDVIYDEFNLSWTNHVDLGSIWNASIGIHL